jgi:phospholipid/cholesterol/gamma-HCH transport system substrate-binding protein
MFEGVPETAGVYRDGATISKKLSGILGDYYLELTPGLQGATLQEGDEIKNVIQGGGPEAILAEAEKITKDISKITSSLADVFGGEDGRQRLDAIFQDVQDISRSIRDVTVSNTERIDRIVDNIERLSVDARVILRSGGDDVSAILADLKASSAELRRTMNSTSDSIDNTFGKVDQAVATTQQALDKLDRSLAHVEQVTQGVAAGEGSVGRILKDDTIAREAESLLGETRTLVATATEAVEAAGGIIDTVGRIDTIIDLRTDYMVGYNAFKNVLSLKLQPNQHKWYLLELIMDPRGKTNTVRRTRDGTGTEPVYEEITETTSAIKVSFEFAGRWEFIAGRFGLIESTGGIGANLYFFDDNIELAADLFDFDFGPAPRLRTYGLVFLDLFLPWDWASHLYFSAGIDDPFNTGTFDYFGGIGFSFNDTDLKGLLTVAPVPSL